jgi:hypothetical protein
LHAARGRTTSGSIPESRGRTESDWSMMKDMGCSRRSLQMTIDDEAALQTIGNKIVRIYFRKKLFSFL